MIEKCIQKYTKSYRLSVFLNRIKTFNYVITVLYMKLKIALFVKIMFRVFQESLLFSGC